MLCPPLPSPPPPTPRTSLYRWSLLCYPSDTAGTPVIQVRWLILTGRRRRRGLDLSEEAKKEALCERRLSGAKSSRFGVKHVTVKPTCRQSRCLNVAVVSSLTFYSCPSRRTSLLACVSVSVCLYICMYMHAYCTLHTAMS